MNEHFVCDQARPRGAAGPRRDLHGGLPGDDRPRRLAAERVPHAGAGAVLRRHLLPARASATGCRAGCRCCEAVAEAWDERREEIRDGGDESRRAAVAGGAALEPSTEPLARGSLDAGRSGCVRSYDPRNGGFGGAPKFPPASAIEFLLRRGETEMTAHTLRAMASGGIYDQVGGGFARYSVDAALARAPLREDALRQRAARPRLPPRLAGDRRPAVPAGDRGDAGLGAARDARPRGRLHSALDADSEGEEGKFYVWTPEQLREVLGDGARPPPTYFGVQPGRQLRGHARSSRAAPSEPASLAEIRAAALRSARASACGRASTTSG